jgi:hypothetical protein
MKKNDIPSGVPEGGLPQPTCSEFRIRLCALRAKKSFRERDYKERSPYVTGKHKMQAQNA